MSWAETHERNDVLAAILHRARRDPGGPLPLRGVGDVDRLFGGEDGVLLALQHRWSTHLAAKLDQAAEDGLGAEVAWNRLAVERPTLRAVLDSGARRSRRLREAQRAEEWIYAAHLRDSALPPSPRRPEDAVAVAATA
jgi:hypothetical protein